MAVLDIYGFHEQDMQKVQDNCIDVLLVAGTAMKDLGMTDNAEQIHNLESNFEEKVQKRFSEVSKRYKEVHDTNAVPLDAIGDCILASMLYETTYTLNNVDVMQELNLAKYGVSDLELNGEYALDELLRRGNFVQEIQNSAVSPYVIEQATELKKEITTRLVLGLAESLHDSAGFTDKNGYDCGEALSNYEKAIGEALGEERLSFVQAFEALQDYRTYDREEKLNEVSEIVDERFQELWQENKKILDLE